VIGGACRTGEDDRVARGEPYRACGTPSDLPADAEDSGVTEGERDNGCGHFLLVLVAMKTHAGPGGFVEVDQSALRRSIPGGKVRRNRQEALGDRRPGETGHGMGRLVA